MRKILIILFLLKIFLSILNRDLLEQLKVIANIFFKKIIVQSILLTTTILKIIFLQKKFVFKARMSSISLFVSNLINNLVIN